MARVEFYRKKKKFQLRSSKESQFLKNIYVHIQLISYQI